MAHTRTPIGGTHVRDFGHCRQQVPLTALPVDPEGFVHFRCLKCPRIGKVSLVELQARVEPTEGLVNILNSLKPLDCELAGPDPWGNHPCGYCYRDLGRANG